MLQCIRIRYSSRSAHSNMQYSFQQLLNWSETLSVMTWSSCHGTSFSSTSRPTTSNQFRTQPVEFKKSAPLNSWDFNLDANFSWKSHDEAEATQRLGYRLLFNAIYPCGRPPGTNPASLLHFYYHSIVSRPKQGLYSQVQNMRPQFSTTYATQAQYILNPRSIRLNLFRKKLSTSFISAFTNT